MQAAGLALPDDGDVPLVAMGLAPLAEVAQGAAAYSPAPMPEPAPMDTAPAPVAETQLTKPAPRIHTRILLASDEARAAFMKRRMDMQFPHLAEMTPEQREEYRMLSRRKKLTRPEALSAMGLA